MFQKTYGQWKPRKEYWFLESGAESVGKPRIEVHRRILVSAQIGGAMHKFEPGKDRWKLGFKETVLANFKFLRSSGFKPVTEDVTLVRYESKFAFVNVYHGRG